MSNYSQGKLQVKERNTTWAKIFDYVFDESVVLDVGCSDGAFGKELKERKKCHVYGIEIDPGDYAVAKKVLDGVFDVNVEREPIPPELTAVKFDAIILADVIEHFVDPVGTLRKLGSLLNEGGRLIFSIPNMSHISVRLQLLGGRFSYNETGLLDKTHLHFYDFEEVKRVFGEAGYQIEHNDANSLPYPPTFLSKKLHSLGLKDDGYIASAQEDMEARTFQFVGYCSKLTSGSSKTIRLSTTTPEHDLITYIENLKAATQKLQEENASLTTDLANVRTQLEHIKNSVPWRTAKKLRGYVVKVKPHKADT